MGSGAQYRDQLCQQYQLAGLRRRKHHELSQPDGRPDGAEFPLRRHRHRRGLRPDPRLRPAENVDPRQCLGRSDAHYPVAAAAALLLVALFFIQQGVPQNLQAYQPFTTLEGVHQLLPMGPVASQEAIKLLGTNGGGFFNANSAHPFENPTALTNLVQMLAIFLIPAALSFAFGEVVAIGVRGRAILWAMTLIFILCVAVVMWAETRGNPHLLTLGADSSLNMEGKESRFGILASSLFAVITTAASCGAVNAMHDSFTALGGMVPMWLMQIGEVVFGGVGSGLYGMLLFVMLAVFIAGLMVGRTPEYLGKKIDVREMKMIALAILVTPTLVLLGTALAMMTDAGRAGMFNPGPHGFSEVLYAVTSAANNNGSAFAGSGRGDAVLEPAAGVLHAGRPLRRHRSGDGHRRLAGGEENSTGQPRHPGHPRRPVYRFTDRHRAAGGRPDLYSCAGAWPAG